MTNKQIMMKWKDEIFVQVIHPMQNAEHSRYHGGKKP
jgi:hypothetical protein